VYSISILIINTLATLIGALLLLRFWMQAIHILPPVSISQFIFKLTNWAIKPLRWLIPGLGGYDWSCLVAAYLVAMFSIGFKLLISEVFSIDAILILSILKIIHWILYGFTFLILIEVIFSWINPHAPLAPFISSLNQPLMRPIRRLIPTFGGIDLSPLIVFLILKIIVSICDNFVRGLFPLKFFYL
tara:strand:- start:1427 stop:1987 length:561 start_codon:yes stop_codon:yes gene_type:complete